MIRKYLKEFAPRRSGRDKFSQYRAAIFYSSDEQKRQVKEVLAEIGMDESSQEALLEPAKVFYPAEEYHQNYYEKMSVGGRK